MSSTTAVGVAALVVLLTVFGLAMAVGLRLAVVASPSMGTAAPVGTLVVGVRPTGALHVGDVVTFRPEEAPVDGRPSTTTHRVVALDGDRIVTRGDANGSDDPGRVHRADVVSRAVLLLPGVGWVFRCLPWMLFGCALVHAVTRGVGRSGTPRDVVATTWTASGDGRPGDRTAWRLVGDAAVVTIVLAVVHPLVRAEAVASAASSVRVVATGLLPARIASPDGRTTTLVPGAFGTIRSAPGGIARLVLAPDLGPVGWSIAAALCLVPIVVAVAVLLVERRRRRALAPTLARGTWEPLGTRRSQAVVRAPRHAGRGHRSASVGLGR